MSTHASRRVRWIAAFTWAYAGCDASDPAGGADAAPQVEMPEIGDRVAVEALCDLYDTIRCRAALGCCGEETFASEAACRAASSCQTALEDQLASPSVTGGAVRYDDVEAAAWLRGLAAAAARCDGDATSDALEAGRLFAGDAAVGDACDPAEADPLATAVCATGLECALTDDDATCATASAPDDGCVADEDCPSGSCVDHACAAGLSPALCMDDAEPPSNGGYDTVLVRDDVPEALRVTAHSSSNSGTTDSITLVLRNSEASYACTISGGVATGASAECVPSKSSSSTDYGDVFYVKYTDKSSAAGSDDGLRMTSFAVKYDGTWYTTQTFDIALSTKIDCEGCFLASDCNSCWLDGDDHNKCLEIKSDAMLEGDGTVQCIDHN